MEKAIRKKGMSSILTGVLTVAAICSGCGGQTDGELAGREESAPFVCVEGCPCANSENAAVQETAGPLESVYAEPPETPVPPPETQPPESIPESPPEGQAAGTLSEGELAARREQQANFAAARQTLYGLPNSMDKTAKINQMDRQILANNAYDFTGKNIVFIGDSITEGIEGAVDANGNFVSYVTYANAYLHFRNVLNHGKGGRMFADYGGEELSLALNFGNVTNTSSDIIVVFAGVNDYLSVSADKRFGNMENTMSTAGYCGAVRYFMQQLKQYYSNNEIFFVTTYNISRTADCTYSDVTGQLTLNDYLEVQRKLAKEYGFQVIELYGIGFMDCSDASASEYYLRDGLHPKDNGNIALGEHIAAELSLYFGQKQIQ